MKKKTQVLVVVMIIGIVLAAVGIGDAMTYLKGKVVNINEAEIGDFDETALVKGEVCEVLGPFAVYEETRKTYGVETGKTETYYYIVSNLDYDACKKAEKRGVDNYFYVVLSTANKDMKKELDAAAAQWEDYYNDETSEIPDVHINIKGKLKKQNSDKDYIKIRDDVLGDIGVDIAEMMVINQEIGAATFVILGVGVVLALGSLIILIVSAVKKKKEKAEELY